MQVCRFSSWITGSTNRAKVLACFYHGQGFCCLQLQMSIVMQPPLMSEHNDHLSPLTEDSDKQHQTMGYSYTIVVPSGAKISMPL